MCNYTVMAFPAAPKELMFGKVSISRADSGRQNCHLSVVFRTLFHALVALTLCTAPLCDSRMLKREEVALPRGLAPKATYELHPIDAQEINSLPKQLCSGCRLTWPSP